MVKYAEYLSHYPSTELYSTYNQYAVQKVICYSGYWQSILTAIFASGPGFTSTRISPFCI